MASKKIFKSFKDISIQHKLYFVVGIMALLILVELMSLWFSINTLSSVRAYVTGEGLWSKAQKDAIYHLSRYGRTHNENDYLYFLDFMNVPMGDHKALLELGKENPDMEKAREGFLEGRNHQEDIEGMIILFRRFHNVSYINKAIRIWVEADGKVFELFPLAKRLHDVINSTEPSTQQIDEIIGEIDPINKELTLLEDSFSFTLGEGSRWLESLVLKLLLAIALTVEFTGLLLTISVSINISRSIKELNRISNNVANGNFNELAKVFSKDEIGLLAENFNQMIVDLKDNIKERDNKEQSLKKQKELYESLIKTQSEMGVGLSITEGEKIVFVNEALCKIFGYSEEELLSMDSLLSLIKEDFRFEVGERLNQMSSGQLSSDFGESIAVRKDKKNINIEYSSKTIHSSNKTQTITIIRDASAKKKAELKFKGLLESAPDAIVIVDKHGIIQLVNHQTERLFEYSREELLGKEIEILIPERFINHAQHRNSYTSNPKTREMGSGLELFGKKKNKAEFPVEISLSPLETEDGMLVSAAIRDVTEKKKNADRLLEYALKLEASNKELEQFAYSISHDLREPLRTIGNYVSLIKMRYERFLDKDGLEFIEFAVDGVKRMDHFIVDILTYSRLGKEETGYEMTDLNGIITTVIENAASTISDCNASVCFEKLPFVNCKSSQMLQLFQNLLSNALKFKRKNTAPKIEISAVEQETEWQFSIKDNGIGIADEYLTKIFTMFRRLHSMSEFEGTGVGLAICKKIVEQHGGKIWVESTVGEGSVFYFTLKK